MSDLNSLLNGYQSTCAIVSGHRLGLYGALREGPVDVAGLAGRLSAGTLVPVHEPFLTSLLRALDSIGIVALRTASGKTEALLTPTGKKLLEEPAASQLLLISTEYLPAWAHAGIGDDDPSWKPWEQGTVWKHRSEYPDVGAAFNRLMSLSQIRAADQVADLVHALGSKVVVDVGGGTGELLAAVIRRNAGVVGVLFERPSVVSEAIETVVRKLPSSAIERMILRPGDFLFDELPQGDTIILRNVLHDLGDRAAAAVLSRVRRALLPGGRALVIEETVGPWHGGDQGMRSLHFTVMHGGWIRTREQIGELLAGAGLTVQTDRMPGILEASAVDAG